MVLKLSLCNIKAHDFKINIVVGILYKRAKVVFKIYLEGVSYW